jgi:hypothetical protein
MGQKKNTTVIGNGSCVCCFLVYVTGDQWHRERPDPTGQVEIEFEGLVKRQVQPTNPRWWRPRSQGPLGTWESNSL